MQEKMGRAVGRREFLLTEKTGKTNGVSDAEAPGTSLESRFERTFTRQTSCAFGYLA